MPRETLSIELTDEEFNFIKDRVVGRYKAKTKTQPDFEVQSESEESKIIETLANITAQGNAPFLMRRRERRFLQALLLRSKKALEQVIIPGYAKRMITPQSKTKYGPYKTAASKTRLLIANLLLKVEEGL